MNIDFSIIVVCLNPKDKLRQTLNSISGQDYSDYEVIIKDGGSTDGSLSCVDEFPNMNISVYSSKDNGIYDAMNTAVTYAKGKFVYFLNCGDYFKNETVLSDVRLSMDAFDLENNKCIFYGNIFERMTGTKVQSNPKINGFACYRNLPCHQACFYSRQLLLEHPFETQYKIRADYEQFVWCFYIANAEFNYVDITVADYEGGGFSETEENLKLSANEHRIITKKYMSLTELFKYKFILFITLSKVRTKLSKNPKTAAFYNKMKGLLYKNRQK